ncbi:unnamed protein product [Rotaria sp. Silwood1]|nr:unnamed protein product [Rotaria sp. Silwood1]CAF3677005.1 unnamed protein product [Rotaria sp. Silwood1]CAF3705159.1 unnamed protein product [Rotaria sp. Silwood1]CAF4681812.1 unnamed protein product [Rotaria sp. Silwood1]CAF4892952.1 unnamed protein product [Rotaria sp. Silwood1]
MHKVDESSSLLNKKKVSCATNDYHQHYSSSLEWTESSWTRFLHALFWWWIKPMLYKGYKQQLTTDDLDGVPQIDKALLLLERLSSYDWSSTTTWRIVYKEFWKDYVFASILIIPRMITSISQPLLLRQILLNIMNEKGSNTASYIRYHEITVIRTDKRVEAFKEFINGCHIAKMYNWEKSLGDRIVEMRDNESASIRRASLYRALNMTIFFMSASLFALTTFGSAWFLGYPLTIDNTFPALALFSVMRVHAMYYIPLAIEKLSVIKSASRRIDSFMRLTMKQDNQSRLPMSLINEQEKGNIMISNASFSWHEDTRFLSVSNLTIKKGALVGIVGPVGSGKSSFFAAILGEMNLINGLLNTNNSSFAYAAQSPWIIEDTFRNNILLNRPLDQQRYRYVIHACCLDDDISIFGPIEDRIMIGENGFNLSGGQRARVSLARALYTDADIYLLDDPLSAVDRKVAKQIYERCLGPFGLLRNKTRLLATHQTEFLNETDQIIFLSHGHVDQRNCLNESIIRENNSNENETSKLVSLLDDNISIDNFRPIVTDEKLIDDSSMFSTLYHLCSAPPFSKNGFCILIIVLLLGEALNSGSNYWLSIFTSVRIIQSHERVEASTAALRLMNAMFVSLWFQWALRELSESDIMMISAKRIDEYSRLPSEEDRGGHKGLVKASSEWPTEGKIKFRNYSLRHRLNSEYAIRDINFCIESGQKIGIIGRTGAGKSSIFKGLFRFVHRSCVDGEILIDNIDISRIALNHLRSHISVIPQQPILFSGTLRYNLDPFNHYSDEECWKALADVQLKQFVSNHSAGLLMSIDKSGKTLSIGQCQLVCIARAILKKSKILLIDEATANVDQETDDIIQAVFRDKFQDRTILTIAHRLHTVARHDRILVLDRGTMVNFDTPANILHSYY